MPTKSEIQKEIILLFSEIAEVDPKIICPQTNFIKDLGVDSMASLELLAAMERQFKVKVDPH